MYALVVHLVKIRDPVVWSLSLFINSDSWTTTCLFSAQIPMITDPFKVRNESGWPQKKSEALQACASDQSSRPSWKKITVIANMLCINWQRSTFNKCFLSRDSRFTLCFFLKAGFLIAPGWSGAGKLQSARSQALQGKGFSELWHDQSQPSTSSRWCCPAGLWSWRCWSHGLQAVVFW